MSPITIVLRSGMGMHIDSVRPYLRNGMPIAIGRAGAVISHFADGDAHLALRTIAEFPCPEQDNMPAANMRQIALAALSGAGASSSLAILAVNLFPDRVMPASDPTPRRDRATANWPKASKLWCAGLIARKSRTAMSACQ